MKLTVAVKVIPTPEPAGSLKERLRTANAVATHISGAVWERRSLLATVDMVDIKNPQPSTPEDWLGVDLSVKTFAVDSEGETYPSGQLRGLRHRYSRIRARLQYRQPEAARKLLMKRRRKERRMTILPYQVISKRIVRKAQDTNSGIALEDLGGIRERMTARKPQRRTMHS